MDDERQTYYYILMFIAISKLILCCFKYYFRHQLMLIKNDLYPIEFFVLTNLFPVFVFELILSIISPSIFYVGYSISTYNSTINLSVEYSINGILQLINILKFFHQLLESFTTLKFNELSIHRINKLSHTKALSWWSPLKNFITNNSFEFMIYSFLLSMMLFSSSALLLERPVAIMANSNFNSWQNSLWFTIITMTTIGYGDVGPKSMPGRILIVFIVLWGNFWNSIFLTTIIPFLQMNVQEKKALNLEQRLTARKKMMQAGGEVITNLIKFHSLSEKSPSVAEIEQFTVKTFPAINRLRSAQKEYNLLVNQSMHNFHDILSKFEKKMNFIDNQLRRAKLLSNIVFNIFRRLQRNSDSVSSSDERKRISYAEEDENEKAEKKAIMEYQRTQRALLGKSIKNQEDLLNFVGNTTQQISLGSSELEFQKIYDNNERKSENIKQTNSIEDQFHQSMLDALKKKPKSANRLTKDKV